MSRLKDHIPTIPCGATICMADFRMQKIGLAVIWFSSYLRSRRWYEDETCAITILRQWRIFRKLNLFFNFSSDIATYSNQLTASFRAESVLLWEFAEAEDGHSHSRSCSRSRSCSFWCSRSRSRSCSRLHSQPRPQAPPSFSMLHADRNFRAYAYAQSQH